MRCAGASRPQARALRLMVPESQWLAVFWDTSQQDTNMLQFLPDVRDGENLSFLFNTTRNGQCPVREGGREGEV